MFVVSIHSGNGSMAEAVTPIVAFLADTEAGAKHLCDALQSVCNLHDPSGELWADFAPIDADDQVNPTADLVRLAEEAIKERFF